ncbi:unannotated protein [freshwater metagenome]|uniref:Unannotated protein n=1 Tax=freshwater metagenome TaxID=449393 RepID=A0A6J6UY35_9ZZZZ
MLNQVNLWPHVARRRQINRKHGEGGNRGDDPIAPCKFTKIVKNSTTTQFSGSESTQRTHHALKRIKVLTAGIREHKKSDRTRAAFGHGDGRRLGPIHTKSEIELPWLDLSRCKISAAHVYANGGVSATRQSLLLHHSKSFGYESALRGNRQQTTCHPAGVAQNKPVWQLRSQLPHGLLIIPTREFGATNRDCGGPSTRQVCSDWGHNVVAKILAIVAGVQPPRLLN